MHELGYEQRGHNGAVAYPVARGVLLLMEVDLAFVSWFLIFGMWARIMVYASGAHIMVCASI